MSAARDTILLIHGLFLDSRSWETAAAPDPA